MPMVDWRPVADSKFNRIYLRTNGDGLLFKRPKVVVKDDNFVSTLGLKQ